jgi:type I restriction enzyme S subunit
VSALWPTVRLGEVLHHRKELVTIDDLTSYKRARVQLHAKGIVVRDEVPGALIKTKKQQVCRAGEFLVAEIDAKVGGFGIVPTTLDGAIVSTHYFLFDVEESKLDRRFLGFFVRTPTFREQVEAQGSTNYAAIRPGDVLGYEMPLPSLSEQRRVVTRIETLAAQVLQARALREQARDEAERLVDSELQAVSQVLSKQYGAGQLGSLLTEAGYGSSERSSPERMKAAVPVLRIPNVALERIELQGLKFCCLSARDQERLLLLDGDILVVRTNGSLDLVGRSAVVKGLPEPMAFASYLIRLRFDHDRVLPDYAQRMLRNLRVSGQLVDFARTTAGQYNVSLGRLRSARIPVPPLPEQRRILAELDTLQSRVDTLKLLQAETAGELDALLPAVLDRALKGEL